MCTGVVPGLVVRAQAAHTAVASPTGHAGVVGGEAAHSTEVSLRQLGRLRAGRQIVRALAHTQILQGRRGRARELAMRAGEKQGGGHFRARGGFSLTSSSRRAWKFFRNLCLKWSPLVFFLFLPEER